MCAYPLKLLGRLLVHRRAGEVRSAWGLPNLAGPDTLRVTSDAFAGDATMPAVHSGRRVGGRHLSPPPTWSDPPPATAKLLLAVEDLDAPTRTPLVHCLALVDPAGLATPNRIPPDGLSRRAPAAGVLLLRSFLGRGYKGPEPIKGHGPHRYAFELFALGAELPPTVMTRALDRAKPRTVLEGIEVPVLARGRLTGLYER